MHVLGMWGYVNYWVVTASHKNLSVLMVLAMDLWSTMFMAFMTWIVKMFRVRLGVRMNIGKLYLGKMDVQ